MRDRILSRQGDRVAARRASVEEDIRETRELTPEQRLIRLSQLLQAITPLARRSPHWEAFSEPVPMSPSAQARWDALVRHHQK